MKGTLLTPLARCRILGAITVLWTAVLPSHSAEPQSHKVQVELQCKLVPRPGESVYRSWIVELQSSEGELLRRFTSASGDTVRFKRLMPAIYLVCVSGDKGRSRCESVDLFPPIGEKAHRFPMEFALPRPMLNTADAHKISSARLAVPERAQREMLRSQECRLQGDNREATLHLERALAIWPRYPEALNNLGTRYHREGKYEKAIQCFRKVTEIDPDFYLGWLNLGGSFLASGSPQKALEAQLRALELRPDDVMANALTAMSYYRLSCLPEARERFLKVAELDPVSAALPHFYLALISMAQNKTAEADEYIRSYLEIHPNSPRSPYLRKVLDNMASSAMFKRSAAPNGRP